MRPLDPQRDQVYDAEALVEGGVRFASADEVRAYVGAVTSSDWWVSRGWPADVAVRIPHRGGRAAKGGWSASGWYVRFPSFEDGAAEDRVRSAAALGEPADPDDLPWAWHEVVIAHELAHVALLSEPVCYDLGHGPVFCRRHAEITRSLAGPDVAAELVERWVDHDVVWYPALDWDEGVGPRARGAALGPDRHSLVVA